MSEQQGSQKYVVIAEHRVASCQPVGADVLWYDEYIRHCLNAARKTVEPLCRACETVLDFEDQEELSAAQMGIVKGSTIYLSVVLHYHCDDGYAEDVADRLRDVVRDAGRVLELVNESPDPARVSVETGMGPVARASEGVVIAPHVVADAVNRIRESVRRSSDRRLDVDINIGCDEVAHLRYSDAGTHYIEDDEVYASDVTVDHVRDADETVMVSLLAPTEAMVKKQDLRMKFAASEVREALLNAQLHWSEVGIRWRAAKKLENGQPVIVGGEILEVQEPAQRSLM